MHSRRMASWLSFVGPTLILTACVGPAPLPSPDLAREREEILSSNALVSNALMKPVAAKHHMVD